MFTELVHSPDFKSDEVGDQDEDHNDKNVEFYEIVDFRKYAVEAGLDNGEDIKVLHENIDLTGMKTAVEVGAGYGRALRFLRVLNPDMQITGIERSSQYRKQLKQEYTKELATGTISLYENDVRTFESEKRFDLGLWLWSGITDFGKSEQLAVLFLIANHLNETGKLIVDVPVGKSNANMVCKQKSMIEVEDEPTYYGYVPSTENMQEYKGILFFNQLEIIPYETSTGRKRQFFIFSDRRNYAKEEEASLSQGSTQLELTRASKSPS